VCLAVGATIRWLMATRGGSGDGDSGRGRIGGLGELVASSSHVLYVFGCVVVLVQLLFWTSLSLMAVW
jgi:hypothetical protein